MFPFKKYTLNAHNLNQKVLIYKNIIELFPLYKKTKYMYTKCIKVYKRQM